MIYKIQVVDSLCLHTCVLGTWRDQTWPDNWTSVTQDGRLSAQFEHTLLVTESGCDVLTKRLDRDGQPYFMDNL